MIDAPQHESFAIIDRSDAYFFKLCPRLCYQYRHGVVKYSLTATISSKGFLGSMQDIKANLVLQLKNLINCAIAPYADPITSTGSGNTKPETNKPKNLATATVRLPQSAFMRGEQLNITIDLTHPRSIQRDPGCWILLQRKENYSAGKYVPIGHSVCQVASLLLWFSE